MGAPDSKPGIQGGRVANPPREACGVVGIFTPGEEAARTAFFGLFSLQHRGQESAGIAAADGFTISCRTEMGLVSQAFHEFDLSRLTAGTVEAAPAFEAIHHHHH